MNLFIFYHFSFPNRSFFVCNFKIISFDTFFSSEIYERKWLPRKNQIYCCLCLFFSLFISQKNKQTWKEGKEFGKSISKLDILLPVNVLAICINFLSFWFFRIRQTQIVCHFERFTHPETTNGCAKPYFASILSI